MLIDNKNFEIEDEDDVRFKGLSGQFVMEFFIQIWYI
jgi:hypothetical protein